MSNELNDLLKAAESFLTWTEHFGPSPRAGRRWIMGGWTEFDQHNKAVESAYYAADKACGLDEAAPTISAHLCRLSHAANDRPETDIDVRSLELRTEDIDDFRRGVELLREYVQRDAGEDAAPVEWSPPMSAEWSPPMTKTEIAKRLIPKKYARSRDFDTFIKPEYETRYLGGNQHQVRIDTLSNNKKDALKAEPDS